MLLGHEVVALVSIVECVVLVLLLLIKMVCFDCAIVVVSACSDAVDCVCVHSWISWWCGSSKVSDPPLKRRQRLKRGTRRAIW